MILRRIAEGIRSQDWFVVTIEVMIVVVGIFIGLQVDDWNEDRKDNEWQDVFLEDLLAEMKANKFHLEDILAFQVQKGENMKRLIDLLEDPKPENKDQIEMAIIAGLVSNPTFFPSTSVYRSALSSGKLELLKDKNLKYAIMTLYDYNYKRMDYNGARSDERVATMKWSYRTYYDRTNQKLISWNALISADARGDVEYVHRINQTYNELARDTMLAMDGVIEDIEAR